MFDEESRVTKYIGIPVLALLVAVTIGYQVKMLAGRFEPAQHEQAMAWNKLEDAYAAMQGSAGQVQQQALSKLQALKGKDMTLYGYMFPIHTGEMHDHFLITGRTLSCQFCFPSDIGNLIEVNMSNAIDYQREPVLITGTFAMDNETETGVVYRLDNATQQPE